MRLSPVSAFRTLRWVVLLPWMCAMDDGCAAIDALHEGRVAARSHHARTTALPPPHREVRSS